MNIRPVGAEFNADGRKDMHKTELIFAFRSFANSSSAVRARSRPGRTWCPLQEYIRHNKHTGAVHTRAVPQSRGRHCSALPCLALLCAVCIAGSIAT